MNESNAQATQLPTMADLDQQAKKLTKALKKVSRAKAAPATAHTQDLPLDMITTITQVRSEMDMEELQLLSESMQAHGLLQPIVVRMSPKAGKPINKDERNGSHPHVYIVIAGHRRLEAARMLKWPTIPAVVRQDVSEEQASTWQLIENIQREELSLADTAAGVLSLYTAHKSLEQVGAMLGKSVPWVSKHLSAATKLSYSVSQLLHEGRTQDLDLLLILNQIDKEQMGWSTLQDLCEGDKMPTRKQAKDALQQLREENKARANERQIKVELSEEEKQARDEEKRRQDQIDELHRTFSAILDQFGTEQGVDVDERLQAIDPATYGQLEKLTTERYEEPWRHGDRDRGHIRMLIARMMDEELYSEDYAAYSLGLQGIPLTFKTFCAEWNLLAIEMRSAREEAATQDDQD